MSREISRRFLAPEVIQASAMDCGPAALQSLLEGCGVAISYGRLREACQTSLDGTSIDTLESVLVSLGINAEQVLVPTDHVALRATQALPAIAVTRLPNGFAHYVVVWRRIGRWFQVMDPARGRRWVTREELHQALYTHVQQVPAVAWSEWAHGEEFRDALHERLALLNVDATPFLTTASADSSHRGLAALDAAVRMATELVRAGAIASGRPCRQLLHTVLSSGGRPNTAGPGRIPGRFWSVVEPEPAAEASPAYEEAMATPEPSAATLLVGGTVLLRIKEQSLGPTEQPDAGNPESVVLQRTLAEPGPRPLATLWRISKKECRWLLPVLSIGSLVSAAGVIYEAILLRGLLEVGSKLGLLHQRLGVLLGLLAVVALLCVLDGMILGGLLRGGRLIEVALRRQLLSKLPRLAEKYFQSRLPSDLVLRAHQIEILHMTPFALYAGLRAACTLTLTAVALLWLAPRTAPLVLTQVFLCLAIPALLSPHWAERDLTVRTHEGSLMRFFLSSLLGLIPVRTHGAEPAVRQEYRTMLGEWWHASQARLSSHVLGQSLLSVANALLTVAMVYRLMSQSREMSAALLTIYFSISIPGLAGELVRSLRFLPLLRNTWLRILEPLTATESATTSEEPSSPTANPPEQQAGVALSFSDVGVQITGHAVLSGLTCCVPAGSHVAIVGASGAGKSTLLGILLGFHSPSQGEVRVDNEPLSAERLSGLLRETAWVDPALHLWNESLLDNLRYCRPQVPTETIGRAIHAMQLGSLLERFPDGLSSALGESGALVSGGEGQRVRMGRALLQTSPRLVLLDEPTRGLPVAQRQLLLAEVRRRFANATLLCVTHDLESALQFPRVLVLADGQLVEQGVPSALATQPQSRFAQLLQESRAVQRELWETASWRRLWVEHGRIADRQPARVDATVGTRGEASS